MTSLSVEDLAFTYPNGESGLRALEGVSFAVQPQEFVCVIGPSGCGKSTLLKVLAGLLPPTEGRVLLGDAPQSGERERNRSQLMLRGSEAQALLAPAPLTGPSNRISLVFQKANLMPWRSVLANVALPL
ncbi:MAG: ATP-binding cassette domain-containing protein, partial [Anaerolineales bacterium]